MDTLEALISRRSIRRYSNQKIDKELIIELIKYGEYAPSACNKQPWYFVIIDDKNILENITSFHPNAKMLKNANYAIVVCGDENKAHDKGYWPVDCSAATENILLAAHAKGLGACWVGIYPRQERIDNMKKLINLPEQIHAFSVIALGYPDEKTVTPDRFDESRIHWNNW
jgi:nitroreductase